MAKKYIYCSSYSSKTMELNSSWSSLLISETIGFRPNSSFPARTYAPSPALATSFRTPSSRRVTTISPLESFRRPPATGIGWPSGEPTPMVNTLIPISAACFAASTGSSSWFSPSVMTMMARLLSLCALKLLIQVLMASPIAVP